MQAIFISYRRDDSEGQAGRLFDDLVRRFGSDRVFMDVAGIQPGLDFRKIIDNTVTSCGVLLALIGPHWLDAKDEAGNPRLDNPSDFVRLETAVALKRDIPVIPVLVQGARMPRPEQLPEELRDLVYRNSSELTHARWDSDVEVLTKALEKIVAVGAPLLKRRSISRRLGLILAILAGASVIGLIAFSLPVGRVTQKPLAEVPSSAVTPVPQNFAGTWQLVSEDW
jgi:hypothetical protein